MNSQIEGPRNGGSGSRAGAIMAATSMILGAIYVILGILFDAWGKAWVVFLLYPVVHGVYAVLNRDNSR